MWETVCETETIPGGITSESERFFRSAVSMPSEHIEQVSSSDLWPALRLFVAGFHCIGLTRSNPFLKDKNVGALKRTQGHRDYRDGKRDHQDRGALEARAQTLRLHYARPYYTPCQRSPPRILPPPGRAEVVLLSHHHRRR